MTLAALEHPSPPDGYFDQFENAPANDAPRSSSERVPAAGLPTVGAETIFAALPPLPYLVHGLHVAPGRPTLVAGYGYSGKTVALQSMALSVATGKPVWGVYAPRKGRVLHLDWEQGARLSYRRYQRLAAGMGVSPGDVGEGLRAAIYPILRIDDPNAEEVLAKACQGFDMVICDSFTAATGRVDENTSEAGRPLYMLGRVSDRTGATVIVVHHARKPQRDAAGGARMSIRGSGAIFGAADSVFIFSAEKGEPIRVSHDRSPSDGEHLADFGLSIEDVEVDGDPRGGMRVVHREGEELDGGKEDIRAKHFALLEKIRDGLRANEGVSGADALAARIGMRAATVRMALRELGDEVQNIGSKNRPHLHLQAVP